MKLVYLAFLPIFFDLILICTGRKESCSKRKDRFGIISDSSILTYYYYESSPTLECWIIEVPEGAYVRLKVEHLTLSTNLDCSSTYLKIVTKAEESYTYCSEDSKNWTPIIAFSDVTVTFSHETREGYRGSFELNYHIEDLICALRNSFRCSNNSCTLQNKVCDGVEDCENGVDEIGCVTEVLAVKGVNVSRENAISWLKNRRSASFGWGKNTHRAITALYLSRAASFHGQNLEEELIVKQLELQTSVALLRNSTDPVSVNELSMFINALTVTCHNPRLFYGHDLLQILGERVSVEESVSPGAYLTLCNSNWTLSQSDIRRLLKVLDTNSKYPFLLDVQAVAVLALTCAANKMEFSGIANASITYNATIEKFISGQGFDGSFGNVYTTALVTQALIASRQESNKQWNVTSTLGYLMNQLNSSSVDFLSAYLALPIFSGRSLVDISEINCANGSRKQDKGNEISDVTNKLGGRMRIQYSLYVGDQKDVIHTIFLRMPDNSSAYDVMRVAQMADSKYKFLHSGVSGHMYIYEIAGITNDPEAGKFWLMYTGDNHHIESPDEFILSDEEPLIMWYKTARILNDDVEEFGSLELVREEATAPASEPGPTTVLWTMTVDEY